MARSSGKRPPARATSNARLRPLGSAPDTAWLVNAGHVDMSQPPPEPRPLTITAAPQTITVVNVKKCFGFVTGSKQILAPMNGR
jgi:hypothetical protein